MSGGYVETAPVKMECKTECGWKGRSSIKIDQLFLKWSCPGCGREHYYFLDELVGVFQSIISVDGYKPLTPEALQ